MISQYATSAGSPTLDCSAQIAFTVHEPCNQQLGKTIPTVLLVHSMQTSSVVWFQSVPPLVARGYRVVVFDLRNFGASLPRQQSSANSDMTEVQFRQWVHPCHYPYDALAVLRSAKITTDSRVSLVCLALGGWVGMPLALMECEYTIDRLVLVCSPGGILLPNLLPAEQTPQAQHNTQSLSMCTQWDNSELAHDFAQRQPQMAVLFHSIGRSNGARPLPQNFFPDLLYDTPITAQVANTCKVPTLFIIGGADREWAVEALQRVAATVGPNGAKVAIVSDAGHTLPLETPEAFHEILFPFLEASAPSDSQAEMTAPPKLLLASPVEVLDRRFALLLMHSIPRAISTGYLWSEGPVFVPDGRCGGGQLVFSDVNGKGMYSWRAASAEDDTPETNTYKLYEALADITNTHTRNIDTHQPTDQKTRFDQKAAEMISGTTRAFRPITPFANGSCLDREGRLVTCEHGSRSVTRTKQPITAYNTTTPLPEVEVETLTKVNHKGVVLTSPNDCVVDRAGRVWFTDPDYGTHLSEGHGDAKQTDTNGVHIIHTDGTVQLVIDDCCRPNGLILTQDEKHLLIADSGSIQPGGIYDSNGPRTIRQYDVTHHPDTAAIECTNGTVVVQLDETAARPDGMTFDCLGNLYIATRRGVEVYACGTYDLLGYIHTPKQAANCIFGGPEGKHLFITASDTVWRLEMRVKGFDPFAEPTSDNSDSKSSVDDREAQNVCMSVRDTSTSAAIDAVAQVAIEQIHAHGITRAQLDRAIDWLRRVGVSDEWEDVLDVFGITQAADETAFAMATAAGNLPSLATPPVIEGPFYRPGAPLRSTLCSDNEPGTVLRLRGTVRSVCARTGEIVADPVLGATLDIWGANYRARYDHEEPDDAAFNLRGIVCCEDGTATSPSRYEVVTRLPGNYSLPDTGPTADYLRAMNRTFVRASHLHVIARAPEQYTLITQVYFTHDVFAEDDSVRAVLPQLRVPLRENGNGELLGNFNIVLVRDREYE